MVHNLPLSRSVFVLEPHYMYGALKHNTYYLFVGTIIHGLLLWNDLV